LNLDTVIENHTLAIGGYKAVENLQCIQIHFHVIEPTFEVDGIYAADRHGRMRVDIYAGDVRVFSEGYDGTSGWQLPKNAQSGIPTSPAGTKALLHGIENHLYGLHEFQSRGHKLELTGEEVIDGTKHHVIRITYKDGNETWRYVNFPNWLIKRIRERKAIHPDVDPTETVLETRLSDFRKTDDVLRPFHEVQMDLSTNQVVQTTQVKELKINPTFNSERFDCP